MGMRIFYMLLLTGLLVCCKEDGKTIPIEEVQQLQITSIDDLNKIEIVTWNIERFPKSNLSDEYLIKFIEGMDADVYFFQEIEKNSRFVEMMGGTDDFNYYLSNTSSSLEFGIVYKKDVVSLKSTAAILTDSSYYFASRPPLLAKIEWKQNGITKKLSLIDVHYKCCGDDSIKYTQNEDSTWDDEYRRLRANQLLHAYITNNISDENVIVVGDWNDAIEEPASTNVFQVFIDDNTNFQFVDMNIASGDPDNWSWQGWGSSYDAIHFDHILINSNLFDEYNNNSLVDIIKAEEYFENGSYDYNDYLSDHRPVYFQFIP